MQKLELSFLNSIPDNESLSNYLRCLPTKTLHYFQSNFFTETHFPHDFLSETHILEENYHIILNFFVLFLQKSEKILMMKCEEIMVLSQELENLRFSLENTTNLTEDFEQLNKKLHERTQILITRNEELELKCDIFKPETSMNSFEKPPDFLKKNDENEDFLIDFYQRETNANFLKKLGFSCECQSKLREFEVEIEKLLRINGVLSIENEDFKLRVENLAKKLEFLYKEFRKSQKEIKNLQEKSGFFEDFKFEFLLNSKRPLLELEIQSATKMTESLKRNKRSRKKLKRSSDLQVIQKENTISISLAKDIEKTLDSQKFNEKYFEKPLEKFVHKSNEKFSEKSNEKFIEKFIEKSIEKTLLEKKLEKRFLELEFDEDFQKEIASFRSLKLHKKPRKTTVIDISKKSSLYDFLVLFVMGIVNLLIKAWNSKISLRKIAGFWPKIWLFLIVLYWMYMWRFMAFFCEGINGISSIIFQFSMVADKKFKRIMGN